MVRKRPRRWLVGMLLCAPLACTVPNPRLCKNGGPCPEDLQTPAGPRDLAGEPRDLAGDLASTADLTTEADAGQCTSDTRCGPTCQPCNSSAHPRCDGVAMRCVCSASVQCGGAKDECVDGACRRDCSILADCNNAPAGKACLGGLPSGRCGCRNNDDCGEGSTCDSGACRCGVTVCRTGQRCAAGACL